MEKVKNEEIKEEFILFQEYWVLLKNIWSANESDSDWDIVLNVTNDFVNKYKGTKLEQFASDITVALVKQIERNLKGENENE